MKKFLSLKVESKKIDNKELILNKSINIMQGQIISMIGMSGVGKSTFLKIISGLDTNYQGQRNLFNGLLQEDIQYSHQEPVFLPWLNMKENLTSFQKQLDDFNINKQDIKLIKWDNLLKDYPITLSGGEKQAFALVRSLSVRPKLLLLDEPFQNCDQKLRQEMRQMIKKFVAKKDKSVLIITHNIEDALILSDKIYLYTQSLNSQSEHTLIDASIYNDNDKESIEFRSKIREMLELVGKIN